MPCLPPAAFLCGLAPIVRGIKERICFEVRRPSDGFNPPSLPLALAHALPHRLRSGCLRTIMASGDNGKSQSGASGRPAASGNDDRTSSPMPAYGVSPTVPNIPPRVGSPLQGGQQQLSSPALRAVDARPAAGTPGPAPLPATPQRLMSDDGEIPTPVNMADLDNLPISDEQKARIIERQ